jgi:hypothetical protein
VERRLGGAVAEGFQQEELSVWVPLKNTQACPLVQHTLRAPAPTSTACRFADAKRGSVIADYALATCQQRPSPDLMHSPTSDKLQTSEVPAVEKPRQERSCLREVERHHVSRLA